MGKNIHFMSETIAQIVALNALGYQTKELMDLIDVSCTSMKHWVRGLKAKGSNDTSTYKHRSGHSKKISKIADMIVRRKLERNPHITARKFNENAVFGEVFVRTVNR